LSQVFCKTSIVAVAVAVDVVVDVDVDVDVTDDVAVEVADALAVDVDVDVEVCDDEDVAVAVDVAVVVEVPVDVDVDDAVDDDVDVDVAVDVDVSEDVAVFVCARSSHIAASPASHPKSLPFSGRKPSVQRRGRTSAVGATHQKLAECMHGCRRERVLERRCGRSRCCMRRGTQLHTQAKTEMKNCSASAVPYTARAVLYSWQHWHPPGLHASPRGTSSPRTSKLGLWA
jgi:hypothetical protein